MNGIAGLCAQRLAASEEDALVGPQLDRVNGVVVLNALRHQRKMHRCSSEGARQRSPR